MMLADSPMRVRPRGMARVLCLRQHPLGNRQRRSEGMIGAELLRMADVDRYELAALPFEALDELGLRLDRDSIDDEATAGRQCRIGLVEQTGLISTAADEDGMR